MPVSSIPPRGGPARDEQDEWPYGAIANANNRFWRRIGLAVMAGARTSLPRLLKNVTAGFWHALGRLADKGGVVLDQWQGDHQYGWLSA